MKATRVCLEAQRLSRIEDGQGERKTATFPQLALNPDFAAMRFNQVFGNGQSQTTAPGGSGAGFIYTVETLKDVGQIVCWDTFAIIGDAYFHPATLLPGSYCHAVPSWSMDNGILQQVTQYLDNPLKVSPDTR